jgi:phosphopantothenoylcysteine synthetase/decarboxylase
LLDVAQVGDEVMHIELTRWADCLVISPLSAHFLAKLANGLCDDLLTSVVRAWPTDKPILLDPAMHVTMWQHTLTGRHFDSLRALKYVYVVEDSGNVVAAEVFDCAANTGNATKVPLVCKAVSALLRLE